MRRYTFMNAAAVGMMEIARMVGMRVLVEKADQLFEDSVEKTGQPFENVEVMQSPPQQRDLVIRRLHLDDGQCPRLYREPKPDPSFGPPKLIQQRARDHRMKTYKPRR